MTRERLYLETMQEVLSSTSKVLVTGKDGQSNLLYLPLDKMIENRSGSSSNSSGITAPAASDSASRSNSGADIRDPRTRETR